MLHSLTTTLLVCCCLVVLTIYGSLSLLSASNSRESASRPLPADSVTAPVTAPNGSGDEVLATKGPIINISNCDRSASNGEKPVRVIPCTTEQNLNIHTYFQPQKSQCPRSSWLEQWLHTKECDDFSYISVGCNKGSDAIQMARLGTNNPTFDVNAYMSEFNQYTTIRPVCELQVDVGDKVIVQERRVRRGEIHCIEPVQSTIEISKQIANKLQLSQAGYHIHQAAISNWTGTTQFSNTEGGSEVAGLDTLCSTNCTTVPVYTLDDYVSQFVTSEKITLLTIDAEGFDFDVLTGGVNTLSKVDYLEFELNKRGTWLERNVMEATKLLEKEFVCYWAGHRQLWRLTGCFEGPVVKRYVRKRFKAWSNVACVSRQNHGLWRIMEDIFLEQSFMEEDELEVLLQQRKSSSTT